MKKLLVTCVATLALAAPASAAGRPSDVGIVEARISSNYVMATVKNLSQRDIDSFTAYFYVFNGERKYVETVEVPFVGTLRPGATAIIKGPIYKSISPGPGIVNFHEVKFFLKSE